MVTIAIHISISIHVTSESNFRFPKHSWWVLSQDNAHIIFLLNSNVLGAFISQTQTAEKYLWINGALFGMVATVTLVLHFNWKCSQWWIFDLKMGCKSLSYMSVLSSHITGYMIYHRDIFLWYIIEYMTFTCKMYMIMAYDTGIWPWHHGLYDYDISLDFWLLRPLHANLWLYVIFIITYHRVYDHDLSWRYISLIYHRIYDLDM